MRMTSLLPAAAGGGMSGMELVLFALPLVALVWVVLASRRRQRDAEARMDAIQVGDQVVTASGMLGRVVSLDGDVARLEIAPGVVVEFARRAVVSTVEEGSGLGTPVVRADAPIAPIAPIKEQ